MRFSLVNPRGIHRVWALIRAQQRVTIRAMKSLFRFRSPNYAQMLSLVATIPLVLAVAAIAALVTVQSRALAEREIAALETQLIEAKKAELRNYVTQARNGFYFVYGRAAPDDEAAKRQVAQILAAMIYGDEGFFFVYDYDGTNLVSPRQTEMINRSWTELRDSEGTPVVSEFITLARQGSGYLTHLWPKPSTGEEERMISFVLGFQDWRWAVGTGVFIDDILATVAAARADVEDRVRRTFLYIMGISLAALLLVYFAGLFLNLRERKLADVKLKKLTERVFDAQEEERGRVARELHDGISQILVGIRYTLDSARRRLDRGHGDVKQPLNQGIEQLGSAISEVRRISRDLRPGVLDDLGLGPAVKVLVEDFEKRTGVQSDFSTVVFRNRLHEDARIALYRIAQEALTNIERHAQASHVEVDLRGHNRGATLRIADNGVGVYSTGTSTGGLGLRNMQERMEQLGGALRILSTKGENGGTVIEATVPLSHILPPNETRQDTSRRKA